MACRSSSSKHLSAHSPGMLRDVRVGEVRTCSTGEAGAASAGLGSPLQDPPDALRWGTCGCAGAGL